MTSSCEKCNDTGWVFITDEEGNECVRECECRELLKAQNRLKASGISDEFQKKGFKNFSDRGKPLLKRARDMAIDYCKKFPEIKDTRYNSIIFMGQVGSGKTHLSMAIGNAIMDKYRTAVRYMPYREEIIRIKQTVRDEEVYNDRIQQFKETPVLMIDDLLKGKNTEADVNILFEIVNYRYLNNLPMIISTEKSIGELLEFDEGTMSRVLEMSRGYQIEFKGREYNFRLNGENT